ncbi:ABC transporter substrate-binding protein [Pseudomonas putida]|uniref:ABC transporter substrate-binding protein n=1 Tax=Pseudomonas putida TaxID=303 RepID=A0AA37RKR4_PSEPU|nr:ABC transporter substrate-binding protein [Pseudomonas putida]GLO37476.1 ABC transporter substrate-binding protein [Pseudomonas putida]HDS0966725.1 ABC transporter substrate-binding protein [Pseudomonas putida]HDS0993118.1 ABC transporter substrate-binding protein [Pseudomonas putida]
MKINWLTLSAMMLALSSGAAHAKDWKEIRFGVNPAYPPFESTAPDGSLQGFDIDLGNAICAELMVKCTWVTNDFDGLIPSLKARKIDAVLSSMTVTEPRKKQVDFSDRLFSGPTSIVTRKGSGLEPTAESLKDKTVGFQQGTIQEAYAKAKLAPGGVRIKAYQNQDQVYSDLVSGRLDASIQDMLEAELGFLKSALGADFQSSKGISDPMVPSDIAIGIRKGDDELKGLLDKAIAQMHASGTYQEIQRKHFGDLDLYNN